MADLKALEKTARDAEANVKVKEKAYKDALAVADTAKQTYQATRAVYLTEKTKYNTAKAAADKVKADGEAAVKKASADLDAPRKTYNTDKAQYDKELKALTVVLMMYNNAKAAADKAVKAGASNAKDLVAKEKNAKSLSDTATASKNAAKAKMEASKVPYDKAVAAHKAASDKAAADNKAAADKLKPVKAAWDKAYADYQPQTYYTKSSAKSAAFDALASAKDAAEKAANAWGDAEKEAAKKAGAAQDKIDKAAEGAKAIIGGVTGIFHTGLEKLCNTRLLKGTKVGTALDFSNCVVSKATSDLMGFITDIGVDTVAGMVSAIYCGKSASEVADQILSAAKNSAKGNWTDVCDKTMSLLRAYDPDITPEDLKEYAKGLKESVKEKMKKK